MSASYLSRVNAINWNRIEDEKRFRSLEPFNHEFLVTRKNSTF